MKFQRLRQKFYTGLIYFSYLLYYQRMVLSDYTKLRILSLYWQGYKISSIVECLVLEDNITVSKQGMRQFLKRYKDHGTIARKPESGMASRLSPANQQIIM